MADDQQSEAQLTATGAVSIDAAWPDCLARFSRAMVYFRDGYIVFTADPPIGGNQADGLASPELVGYGGSSFDNNYDTALSKRTFA